MEITKSPQLIQACTDVIQLLEPNWDLEQTKGYKKKPWSASLLRVTSVLQPGNADWQRAALQQEHPISTNASHRRDPSCASPEDWSMNPRQEAHLHLQGAIREKCKAVSPWVLPPRESPWPRAALPPEEAQHGWPSAAQRPSARGSKTSRRPSPVPPACARLELGLWSSRECGNLAASQGLGSVPSHHLKSRARQDPIVLFRWDGRELISVLAEFQLGVITFFWQIFLGSFNGI